MKFGKCIGILGTLFYFYTKYFLHNLTFTLLFCADVLFKSI